MGDGKGGGEERVSLTNIKTTVQNLVTELRSLKLVIRYPLV